MFFYAEPDDNSQQQNYNTQSFVMLALTSSKNSLALDSVGIGSSSQATFVLTAGAAPNIISIEPVTLVGDTDQFSFSPSSFTMTPGVTNQVITVTFNPTSWGIKTGSIFVSAVGGSTKKISLAATCVADPLIITSSAGILDLGSAYVNETSSATFTVSAGGRVQDIVLLADDSDQFDFSPSSFSMTGTNQTQAVTVYFTPTSGGSKLGLLTLSASGGDVAHVSLNGSALYRPLVLTSSVNGLNIGSGYVNETASATFTVSAGGIGGIETVTLSDNSNQFDFSPSSFSLIGGGSSQTVTAKFTPSSSGTKNATLTLSSSGGSTKNIALTGSGIYRALVLTSSVGQINFGNGYVNETSSATLTVSAGGVGAVETVVLSDNSNQFDFSPSSFSLTGGSNQLVTTYFTPNSTGSKLGLLTLSSSGGSVKNVSLTGSGIYRPLEIGFSIGALNFAQTEINKTSSNTFTVAASGLGGTEAVTLSNNSNQFSFSPSSFNITAGGTQTISGTFAPTTTGSKSAVLTLSSSGGTNKSINISGDGMPVYYGDTSVLLKGDAYTYGLGGQIYMSDSGPNGVLVTTVGSASISSNQSKYGSSSLYFNGSTDLLNVGTGSAVNYPPLNLGNSDWTLEFWCNPISSSLTSKIIYASYGATTSATNRYLFRFSNGKFGFYHRVANLQYNTVSNIPFGTWSHIAITRQNSTIRIFLNGVLENTITGWTRSFDSDPSHAPTIGGYWQDASTYGPQGWYKGYLDDFRITKNVALYTANFTPPGSL